MYQQVKEDMFDVHKKIGLPLKCTYTSVNKDSKILNELGITATKEPVYNFLGLIWNMKENNLRPNSYFPLNKRRAGLKSGSLTENVDEDDSFLGERKITF